MVCVRRPLAFRAADTGQDRVEHLVDFGRREGPLFLSILSDQAAEFGQAGDACAKLNLRKKPKVPVGDAIEMFRAFDSLVLTGLQENLTEFSGGWPAFLVRGVPRFRIGVVREGL
jgi:hypothetical protein